MKAHPFIEWISKVYTTIFPLYLVRYHYYRIDQFKKRTIEENDIKGKKIIDIGSFADNMKKQFRYATVLTNDIQQDENGTIDIVADVNDGLPTVKSGSIDVIICTQVIEHLKKPAYAYTEFARILKPGGKMYLTTNLCYEEHMVPYDYFRFTRYGLRYLGEDAKLNVIHLEPHGGIFILLSLLFDTIIIKQFTGEGSMLYYVLAVLTTPIRLVVNAICIALDQLDRQKIWTINYEVIYQKPL